MDNLKVTGNIDANLIAASDIATVTASISDSLAAVELSAQNIAATESIAAPHAAFVNASVTQQLNANVEVTVVPEIPSDLTLDNLKVTGNIEANIIDAVDIATTKVAVTGSLSAMEISAQNMAVSESLAAKEAAFVDTVITGELDAKIVVADLANVKDITLDSLTVASLNATNATVTGDLDAKLDIGHLANVRDLTLDSLTVASLNATNASVSGDLDAKLDIADLTLDNLKVTGNIDANLIAATESIAAPYAAFVNASVTQQLNANVEVTVVPEIPSDLTLDSLTVSSLNATNAIVTGDLDAKLDLANVNDLTLDNLKVTGNIEANVIAASNIAAVTASITDSLATVELAAQSVAINTLAAEEAAFTNATVVGNLDANVDVSVVPEIPSDLTLDNLRVTTLSIDGNTDSFVLQGSDDSLIVKQAENMLLELSNTLAAEESAFTNATVVGNLDDNVDDSVAPEIPSDLTLDNLRVTTLSIDGNTDSFVLQ